jgi:hypothetical protein
MGRLRACEEGGKGRREGERTGREGGRSARGGGGGWGSRRGREGRPLRLLLCFGISSGTAAAQTLLHKGDRDRYRYRYRYRYSSVRFSSLSFFSSRRVMQRMVVAFPRFSSRHCSKLTRPACHSLYETVGAPSTAVPASSKPTIAPSDWSSVVRTLPVAVGSVPLLAGTSGDKKARGGGILQRFSRIVRQGARNCSAMTELEHSSGLLTVSKNSSWGRSGGVGGGGEGTEAASWREEGGGAGRGYHEQAEGALPVHVLKRHESEQQLQVALQRAGLCVLHQLGPSEPSRRRKRECGGPGAGSAGRPAGAGAGHS